MVRFVSFLLKMAENDISKQIEERLDALFELARLLEKSKEKKLFLNSDKL